MKNFSIVLAAILALTLGSVGTAAAQPKGGRDGAQKQRHTSSQQRAGTQKFQHATGGRHGARQGRWHDPRRSPRMNKRIWRMHGKRHRWAKRGFRQHRRYHRGLRHPRVHVPRVYRTYPVYEQSFSPSVGFEIETPEVRVRVHKSQ